MGRVGMLQRIFAASSIFFLIGTLVFLIGSFFLPDWSRVTLPAGMLTMSVSGIVLGIAGAVLILHARNGV